MEKFLKENWFKIGILLTLLIVACSFAYYQISYLPLKTATSAEAQLNASNIQNSLDCNHNTESLFTAETKNLQSDFPTYQSHYNPILQKCFGFITYIVNTSANKEFNENQLYDVYDNNLLADYNRSIGRSADESNDSCIGVDGNLNIGADCNFDNFEKLVNTDMQNTVNF